MDATKPGFLEQACPPSRVNDEGMPSIMINDIRRIL